MKNGCVSIVVPMFNAERYIGETLASVRAQHYGEWELIVVDDGSGDASAEKVQAFIGASRCEVKLLRHPGQENRGTSASRNLGLHHAKGEYLCFLDADDVWHPEFLGYFAGVLSKHPEVAMTFGPAWMWHTEPNDGADYEQALGVKTPGLMDPLTLFEEFLVGEADTPSPSGVMMRRRSLEAVGGWEETFPGMYDDQVVYSKLLLGGGGVYVTDRCLYRYRQHQSSVCKVAAREKRNADSRGKYLEWLRHYLECRKRLSNDLEVLFAEQMWNVQRQKEMDLAANQRSWNKINALRSLVVLLAEQRNFLLGLKLFGRILGQQTLKPAGKFMRIKH